MDRNIRPAYAPGPWTAPFTRPSLHTHLAVYALPWTAEGEGDLDCSAHATLAPSMTTPAGARWCQHQRERAFGDAPQGAPA